MDNNDYDYYYYYLINIQSDMWNFLCSLDFIALNCNDNHLVVEGENLPLMLISDDEYGYIKNNTYVHVA